MESKHFTQLAARLLRAPTAPYHEAGVRDVIETICREHGLEHTRDRYGNLLVRHGRGGVRPLVLAAHMDHPAFEVTRALEPGRWETRFLGGVPPKFFRPGTKLLLQPGNAPARLGPAAGGPDTFTVTGSKLPPDAPRFAVWDVEAFAARAGRIHARQCDDLIGVAVVLATLIELKQRGARARVIGVLSRAEEVGFHGALTVAASATLPRHAFVVSLETSRELPPVEMGQGVIIRTGDRASVFDSAGTRYLTEVAAALRARDQSFAFQRALMPGGTCEATAYQEYGFQTAAVCIALGNYHNCGPRGRVAAEYVSVADARGMVRLLVEAAVRMGTFGAVTMRLPLRLKGYLREARKRLRK
jgi:endoglucanase